MNKTAKRISAFSAMLILMLTAVLLLAGCGMTAKPAEETAPEGPQVYYVNNDMTGLRNTPVEIKSKGDAMISDMFLSLRNGDFPDGRSAVPESLELDHTAWQEKTLVLYLNGDYPEVGTMQESLLRAALVKSMLSVAEADSVVINVNGNPLTNEYDAEVGNISADDFIDTVMQNETEEEIELTLYFGEGSEPLLSPEERYTSIEEGYDTAALAKMAVSLLIGGPQKESLRNVIPAGTEATDVTVTDGICYVNLNDTFGNQELDYSYRLPVYSIVNTLCAIPGINMVQLTVNGSADIVLEEGLSIKAPLEADEELIR